MNDILYKIFNTQKFRTYLTTKLKYVNGTPYLLIYKNKLYCEYIVSNTFYDDYNAQNNYKSPSDDIKKICVEYIKEYFLEIYNELIKKIDYGN